MSLRIKGLMRDEINMYFSIIIPIYNVETYLKRCLNSILKQSFLSYEIILIDDGSTDKSKEICKRYVENNRNIYLYELPHSGVSVTRNKGINVAKGEYLVFVDADDFIEESFLEMLYKTTVSTVPDICYLNTHYVIGDNERRIHVVFEGDKNYKGDSLSPNEILTHIASYNGSIPGSTWLMIPKNSFIKEHNIYFKPELAWSEDTDFSYTVLVNSKKVTYCTYCGYNWVVNNVCSASKTFSLDKVYDRMDVYKNWYLFFHQNGEKLVSDRSIQTKIEQKILENYCSYLKEYIHIKNKIDKKLVKKRLLEEKNVWKATTAQQFKIYRYFGLRIGTIIQLCRERIAVIKHFVKDM